MNAAIDQQCERYIAEHKLEHLVEAKFKELYDDRGLERPSYQGKKLPKGNDGLGLTLLGLTGDQVLPPDIYAKIKAYAIATVRGTVQADILKEDQAQNTCIFSTEFALRMMGDIQQYFIDQKGAQFLFSFYIRLSYCRSAPNPVTQLAFAVINGFTYVEYLPEPGDAY